MQTGNYILKYNCGVHIFLLDMQCLARVQQALLAASISSGVGIFNENPIPLLDMPNVRATIRLRQHIPHCT